MTKHEEYALQCDVVKLLRENNMIVFSIPNERNQGISDAIRMRASGLTKGAPDLICWNISGKCFWLELKTPKGKRSIEQECMEDIANTLQIKYLLVRSVEDVKNIL